MPKIFAAALLSVSGAVYLTAQPSFTAGNVLNGASYALPGLPNSSIAQGSLFVVFGSNLGAASNLQELRFPLPTALNGTSIRVTVGDTSVDAFMIYTTPTQAAGILPSSTPVGAGRLTLTTNSQSASAAVTVVRSSFGTFTLNTAGSGQSIIQNVISETDRPLNSVLNPARPGQPVILWGTGLGAVRGDDGAGPLPGDLKDAVSAEVFVGNRPARVIYAGRSGCCAGIDQVVFEVPEGVEGCYVTVAVRTGGADGVVSNFTSMAVAPASRQSCSDANGISPTDLAGVASAGRPVRIGVVDLSRVQLQVAAGLLSIDSKSDLATAVFGAFSPQQLAASRGIVQSPSVGSCAVSTFRGFSLTPADPVRPAPLDAGTLTIAGVNGSKAVPQSAPGVYSATLGGVALDQILTGLGLPDYLSPGDYAISGGGPDVGNFTARLGIPQPVDWTNRDTATEMRRTTDLELTWTGGDPAGFVTIIGIGMAAGTGGTSSNSPGAAFLCVERTTAGRFRVPSFVIQALPPSTAGSLIPSAFLLVGSSGAPARFDAPGLDAAYLTYCMLFGKSVIVR